MEIISRLNRHCRIKALITSKLTVVLFLFFSSNNQLLSEETLAIGGSGLKAIEIDLSVIEIPTQPEEILTKRYLYHPDHNKQKQIIIVEPDKNRVVRVNKKLPKKYNNENRDQKVVTKKATDLNPENKSRLITETNLPKPPKQKAHKIIDKKNPVIETKNTTTGKSKKQNISVKDKDTLLKIIFPDNISILPNTQLQQLASLAKLISNNPSLRLQLKAYASGNTESASDARRLSLSRALSVRTALIEQGLRSTRIDVRALGSKGGNEPDRVDIFVVEP